jgi:TonB family protein
MPLRCLLFCCDDAATQLLVRVLAELQIDAELCPNAVTATERITSQPFQIVILDWDDQPDAALLLNAARTRKASERPLILALAGDDAGVPKALQAGANSILRKPVLVNQARDILTTARDLLRAKLEQSASTAKAFAAKAPASPAKPLDSSVVATTLRAGEFLQSSVPQPGAQFTTDSDLDKRLQQLQEPAEIDPLEELEPMAASLQAKDETQAGSAPAANQPRGLAWYKARNAPIAGAGGTAAAPALAAASPSPSAKADLLAYDQTPSYSSISPTAALTPPAAMPSPMTPPRIPEPSSIQPATWSKPTEQSQPGDQENEAQLFAHIAGERVERAKPTVTSSPSSTSSSSSSLPNYARYAVAAFCLSVAIGAAVAYWKLPQSLWKPRVQQLSTHVMSAVHGWLNPQPVTPAQAPPTHESFARAGDEYKLPVAEAIPDATTDPSQIHVLPVIDPTAKQPNAANANAAQTTVPDAASASNQPQLPAVQAGTPPTSSPSSTSSSLSATQSATPSATQSAIPLSLSSAPAGQPNSPPVAARPDAAGPFVPVTKPNLPPQTTAVSSGIPSSLRSQMASSTPEASGNKSPDAAMPSIEPVSLPEAAARSLLQQQAAPAYPDSAKGQSGIVVLQVLIARDGSVQDAKFMQGSLVFARAAIDAVKQWHFQPYMMNGRAVSAVTSLTVNFKPGS